MKNKSKFVKKTTIDELQKWKKNFTAISLFSGCGGCALGFSQAGINVRVAVEWDKWACETLRSNFTKEGFENNHKKWIEYFEKGENRGDKKAAERMKARKVYIPEWYQKLSKQKGFREMVVMQADITKLSTKEILEAGGLQIGEASILEGGFPCQGFSHARGKRMINDPRNSLYKECVRVISEALPKVFMLENVPGIVSMSAGEVILQVVQDLAAVGYNISWNILDACDYGVPQHRKRVILFGLRQDGSRLLENGRIEYHIGCMPGTMSFPQWYFDRYTKKNNNIAKLLDIKGIESSEGSNGMMITIPAKI